MLLFRIAYQSLTIFLLNLELPIHNSDQKSISKLALRLSSDACDNQWSLSMYIVNLINCFY